jgi:hypothetical protein
MLPIAGQLRVCIRPYYFVLSVLAQPAAPPIGVLKVLRLLSALRPA